MLFVGADKLFFVTTNPEDQADEALKGMFKFLAAKETDAVKEITIRFVADSFTCFQSFIY